MTTQSVKEIADIILNTELSDAELRALNSVVIDKLRLVKAVKTLTLKTQLKQDTPVKTSGLKPKGLNGLTGRIVDVRKSRADIKLDKEPALFDPIRKYTKLGILRGIPLACLSIVGIES